MLLEIKGYANYRICDESYKIFNTIKNKEIEVTDNKYCKMKSDDLKWNSITISTVKGLANIKINIIGYSIVPETDEKYYINENGSVISFAKVKCGEILKISYPNDNKHYPTVSVLNKCIGVHVLLAKTFIDHDYIENGLVCMHLDNNKNNHTLSNIKLGTYSENNKQAYEDGINLGNGLKKIK